MLLNIKNLSKTYGDHAVLHDISFEIGIGEVVSIIGPSGGGKSVILRCIKGLDNPTHGHIELGATLTRKEIGMVFQNFNLFNNMTVLQNVMYPLLKVSKFNKKNALEKANISLEAVGMANYKGKYPYQLSGGQKQRTAIARTIAIEPKLILFDEPTSALDPENVGEVLFTIEHILNLNSNTSMLIVTHEMKFAEKISDRVIFVDSGKVLEISPTSNFFKSPQTQRAKTFLAKMIR